MESLTFLYKYGTYCPGDLDTGRKARMDSALASGKIKQSPMRTACN